jgi:exonuclease SbcD
MMPMTRDRIRFLHCADIHLDAPFGGRGHKDYSEMRRNDVWATFESIIRLAEKERSDFILVCGDLYEHDYASKATIQRVASLFERLTIPVVVLPGNHDPYAANSWYKTWNWPDNVVILNHEKPSVRFDSLCAFIHGVGFSAFRQDAPDLSMVSRPGGDRFNIFMLHGTLDMNFSNSPFNPVSSEELAGLGYDYYALGHFHNRKTDFQLKNAANPGSPEPLGFDETGDHGVFLVTLEKDESGRKALDIREVNLAQKRYVWLDLDMENATSQEEASARLGELLKSLDPGRDLPRVVLFGRTSLAVECEALKKPWLDDFPWLQILDETRDCYDYEAISREENLKGAFTREMLQRLEECGESGDDEQAMILSAALDLGIEALEKGRIDARIDGGLFRGPRTGEGC